MSNNSSPSTPSFGGEEFIRILAGIPVQEFSPDFFSPDRPRRYADLVAMSPTPRPIPPYLNGDVEFPVDFSPYGQRFDAEEWRQFSPPAIMIHPFRYASMTPSQDSGYSTHQESQMVDWHRVSPVQHASPVIPSPSTPTLPRRQFLPRRLFSPAQSPEMDWSDDGNNAELNRHMDTYERGWDDDGYDKKLIRHMETYECCATINHHII